LLISSEYKRVKEPDSSIFSHTPYFMDQSDSFQSLPLELDSILSALFHTTLEGIMVTNAEGRIVLVNKRCCELFGYTEEEFLQITVEDLLPANAAHLHPTQRKAFYNNPAVRAKGHRRYLHASRKDGSEFIIEVGLNPVETADGLHVIAHVVDVSEQLQAEDDLKESKIRLSAIIEAAVDGIITIDTNGIIETVNPSAARLFGYPPEEIVGQNIRLLMPEPYRGEHDGYIHNYHETGRKKIIGLGREVSGRKKDGSTFPFYLSVSEVKLRSRKIYTGIIHDLTEQKAAEAALKRYSNQLEKRVLARTQALNQAIVGLENEINERKQIEQRLREAQQEMEQALAKERELNELKSRFVSMASHEFRTPLATILSSLNLLIRYTQPEQADRREKHINRIRNNVHNLTGILNDFLSLSKLEEGVIEVRDEFFEIDELATELRDEMQAQAKKGQEISYRHEGETRIFLDPNLLRNIMVNLLNNAVKYSPENSQIFIRTSRNHKSLSIEIADQGMGIPKIEQQHLFERFFRAHNVTNIQGTGLGLSIVKRYVDLLNGSIEFVSSEQKGTTFTIHFPQPSNIKS
jgi:two-component system sensor kinase FixL